MEVSSGDGEDDDDEDPSMLLHGTKKHLSRSCSSDLLPDFLHPSSALASQDRLASSKHIGHHLNMVEDIMQKHWEVGYHEDCDGVIHGVSLLSDTLLISFTDRQLVFHASSQPHGQSGRQVADHNGEKGRQGEAAPVQEAVGCSMMLGWGTDGYATDGSFLSSSLPWQGQNSQDFQASSTLGQLGSLVGDGAVGGIWAWVEVSAGVPVSSVVVGNCGVGQR